MKNNPNQNTVHRNYHDLPLGRVYLFENYIVAEFKEGVDITFDNFSDVAEIIKKQFEDQPFGFIANRLNSYSINLMHATKFNTYFPNLKAYAVVAYTAITKRVFEVENHFFTFNRASFQSLDDAVQWVEQTLPANG